MGGNPNVPEGKTGEPIIIDVNDMEDQAQNDTPDVPMRAEEKKRLNWAGKTCEIQKQSKKIVDLISMLQISHH